MKFFSENHSGDVNNHSGRIGFFIHLSPESLFTSRRNPYSHHSGTIIHMPRNPHVAMSFHPSLEAAFTDGIEGSGADRDVSQHRADCDLPLSLGGEYCAPDGRSIRTECCRYCELSLVNLLR
jgi:hypothetical protein